MSDPKYVRLAQQSSSGTQVDLDTGWSISGLDVKKFPEHPRAAQFVRSRLTRNILEPASKAEYDEVQESNAALASIEEGRQAGNLARTLQKNLGLPGAPQGHQEANLQQTAELSRMKLQEARKEDGTDSVSQTRKRRRELIASRKGESGDTADYTAMDDDEMAELNLGDLRNADLQALAEARDLSTGGTKAELVDRLEQYLEEEEDES